MFRLHGKTTLGIAVVLMLLASCANSTDAGPFDSATTTAGPLPTMMPLDQATGLVVMVAPECDVCDALVAELSRRAEVARMGDGNLCRSEIGHSVWVYNLEAPNSGAPSVQVVRESGKVRRTWHGEQALLEIDDIITLGCEMHSGVCPYEIPCVIP